MVNISKKYLENNLRRKAWQKLQKEIGAEINLQEVFRKLFTASELVMIEKRLLILILLEEDWSYLKIRHLLDVSPGTISFVKQVFKINKRKIKTSFNLADRYSKKKTFEHRKFPAYVGKGRWSFLNNY